MNSLFKRGGVPLAVVSLVSGWTGPTDAAEKISLGIGGYMIQYFGYAENDDLNNTDQSGLDVKSDTEISVAGDMTLDNGVQIGAEAVLNGNSDSGEQLKDSFAWGEGRFGRLEIGKRDNAAAIMQYSAPDVGLGINDSDIDDWINNPTGGDADSAFKSTYLFLGEDKGTKLTYFTPRFMDIQIGVSYIPEFERDSNAQPGDDLYHDGIGIGINYVRDLGNDMSLAVAGGFLTATEPDNSTADAAEGYSFGFEFSVSGFTLGGSYASVEGNAAQGIDTATSLEGEGFDIGISYAFDPVTVSLSYFSGEFEDQVSIDGDSENDTVMFSANYELGPGVSLLGTVFHSEFKDENGTDNEGTAALVGLTLEF